MRIEELRQLLLPREAHLAPTVEYDAKRLRESFRGSQPGKGKGSGNAPQRPSSNRRSLSILQMQTKGDGLSSSGSGEAGAAGGES